MNTPRFGIGRDPETPAPPQEAQPAPEVPRPEQPPVPRPPDFEREKPAPSAAEEMVLEEPSIEFEIKENPVLSGETGQTLTIADVEGRPLNTEEQAADFHETVFGISQNNE